MKCLICGKDEVYVDNLCLSCYFKKVFPKIVKKNLKKKKINFCINCNSLYIGRKKCEKEEDLIDWLSNTLLIDKELIDKNIGYDHIKKEIVFNVYNFCVGVKLEEFVCSYCKSRLSKKHNLKIQIRGSSDFLDKSCKIVEKILERSKVNVVEIKEVKNGIDFLVNTNNKAISSIDSLLSKYFIIKKTYKIDTIDRRTSKLKKVATILIRSFKNGIKI